MVFPPKTDTLTKGAEQRPHKWIQASIVIGFLTKTQRRGVVAFINEVGKTGYHYGEDWHLSLSLTLNKNQLRMDKNLTTRSEPMKLTEESIKKTLQDIDVGDCLFV